MKQLYLDCYICSENVMGVLMSQLRNCVWISSHQFMLCLEEIQSRSLDQLGLFPGESFSHKKSSTIQKLLCKAHPVFYKFTELQGRRDLNIIELRQALSMSLRDRKHFTEQLVDNALARILERLAEISKVVEGKVSFDDFYFILRQRKLSSASSL